MTAQRTRLTREDRRERILAAAIEIIGDKGFRGFSIRDLAIRCAMTDAGLLHHFGSKVGLLTAVLDERDRQDEIAVAAMLGEQVEHPPRSAQAVRAIFRSLVRRNAENPEIVRLYAMLRVEALAPDHPAYPYFRQRDAQVQRMFGELVSLITDEPESLARQILIAIDGLELQWLRDDQGFDLLAEWEKFAGKLIGA